jgi:hypothetical protein
VSEGDMMAILFDLRNIQKPIIAIIEELNIMVGIESRWKNSRLPMTLSVEG